MEAKLRRSKESEIRVLLGTAGKAKEARLAKQRFNALLASPRTIVKSHENDNNERW